MGLEECFNQNAWCLALGRRIGDKVISSLSNRSRPLLDGEALLLTNNDGDRTEKEKC